MRRGLRLSADDRLRRQVIQRLMCDNHLDYAGIERRHHIVFRDNFADELDALVAMAEDGLVAVDEDGIEGFHGGGGCGAIATVFDPATPAQPARFSRLT